MSQCNRQKLIEDKVLTQEEAKLYRFKNNGDVVRLQTQAEYEKMYPNKLNSSYYTITNGSFTLTLAGRNAAKDGTITELVIPYGVQEIGNGAAEYCVSITKVVMPDTVETICNFAFRNCNNIKSVVVSKKLKRIQPFDAFTACTWWNDIHNSNTPVILGGILINDANRTLDVIPKSVETIGPKAFSGNESIKSITIPNTVSIISTYAFSYCSNLSNIVFEGNIPEIGQGSLNGTNISGEIRNIILEKNNQAFEFEEERD